MKVKALVGIRLFGGRNFGSIIEKYAEMHRKCITPYADTFICGDDAAQVLYEALTPNSGSKPARVGERVTFIYAQAPTTYAEDMLWIADEESRLHAIKEGYEKLVWQDVDMLYRSPADFKKLISHDLAGVGALQGSRQDSSVAICRRFIPDSDGLQKDVPRKELRSGKVIPTGFPGAGALSLRVSDIADLSWDQPDSSCVRWYERVAAGRPNICAQEWYVMEMNEQGRQVYCDTAIKPWHIDEDGIGRTLDEEVPLEDLTWP